MKLRLALGIGLPIALMLSAVAGTHDPSTSTAAVHADHVSAKQHLAAQPRSDCADKSVGENYGDGSLVPAGKTITKYWKIPNCGTTNWKGYSLVRQYGQGGSAADNATCIATPITNSTPPGETVKVSIKVHVPDTPGVTFGVWYQISPEPADKVSKVCHTTYYAKGTKFFDYLYWFLWTVE